MSQSPFRSVIHGPGSLVSIALWEPAIPLNQIRYQREVPTPELFARYSTKAQLVAAVHLVRWLQGFVCPRWACESHYIAAHGAREPLLCRGWKHQASPSTGMLRDSTKSPLSTWFLVV